MADKKAKTKQNLVIALVAYLFLLYMAVYFLSTRNSDRRNIGPGSFHPDVKLDCFKPVCNRTCV